MAAGVNETALVIERVPMALKAARMLSWSWARWVKPRTRTQACSRWHAVQGDVTACGMAVPAEREVFRVVAAPRDGKVCAGCLERVA